MRDKVFVVVSYDITDDKRRTKIMKTLKNFGRHVQFSVFECELDKAAYDRLRGKLDKLVVPKEDNVRFYFFDEDAIGKIETIGTGGQIVRMQSYYFIG